MGEWGETHRESQRQFRTVRKRQRENGRQVELDRRRKIKIENDRGQGCRTQAEKLRRETKMML